MASGTSSVMADFFGSLPGPALQPGLPDSHTLSKRGMDGKTVCQARMRADLAGGVSSLSMRADLASGFSSLTNGRLMSIWLRPGPYQRCRNFASVGVGQSTSGPAIRTIHP